jgi:hypothetical protein
MSIYILLTCCEAALSAFFCSDSLILSVQILNFLQQFLQLLEGFLVLVSYIR